MPELFGIDLKSSTFEALINHCRDGIESVAATWMTQWESRQLAGSLRELSEAHDDAMNTLLANEPNYDVNVSITSETRKQSITSQGKRRAKNVRNVIHGAVRELIDQDVEERDHDPDFPARFFGIVQDVSDIQLQSLWSKLLAGEVKHPGQTSARTLSVLKDMSPREASFFEECSQYVINNEFIFMRDVPQSRHNMPGTTLYFKKISLMQAAGLIAETLDVKVNYDTSADPFIFSIHSTHFCAARGDGAGENLRIPVLLLTPAGQELCRVTRHYGYPEPYLKELAGFLQRINYQLYLLDKPRKMPGGRTTYKKTALIHPA